SGGSEGLGFVVTIKTARELLIERKSIWGGLEGTMLTGDLAEIFNVPGGAGYLVKTAAKGSPAWNAGVLGGDRRAPIHGQEIVVIMGGSGCGKSTLLRHLIGLVHPARGGVLYDGESFWTAEPEAREGIMRRFGVLYQSGALWSSLTLAENVSLPLGEYTRLTAAEIAELVSLKLALVGLAGFEEFYPSEISGGMRKRGGLARAMALDPD